MRSKSRLIGAVLSAGLGLALLLSGCGKSRSMPAPGVGTHTPALRVLTFYDDRGQPGSSTVLPLVNANRAAISDLAPRWYTVMADGSLRDLSQNYVKTFARKNNIRLMPLVTNGSGTSAFLLNAGNCTAGACAAAVNNLAAMLRKQNYDGLNIDFELLKPKARQGLVAFMRQLHARTQAMGKQLTVDVIPAGNRRQAAGAYDFPALAQNSDDVVLMTYDAHDDTSRSGPIAPLAWVRQRVNLALSLGVPPKKLILGLADYGYDWTSADHATTVSLKQAQSLIQRFGVKVARTSDGEPHFTYTTGGTTHTVWYEDGRAILPKIQLARQLGLKGLALWVAGDETALYWHSLRAAAGTLATTGAFSGAGASAPVSATTPSSATSSPSGASASSSSGSSTGSGGGTSGSRSATSTSSASSASSPSGSSASGGTGSSASSSSS